MLRHLFKKIPKKKKGVSEIFLTTSICIFIFLSVFCVSVVDLKPFFIKLKLMEVNRQAVLRMETDGGLTDKSKQLIINSLKNMQGFKESNLEISPSCVANEYTFANYGDSVKLSITYNYIPKSYSLVGWTKLEKKDGAVKPITSSMEVTSTRIKIIEH